MLDPNQIHVKLINRSKLKSKNFNLRAVDWGNSLLLTAEYIYMAGSNAEKQFLKGDQHMKLSKVGDVYI